MSAVLKSRSEPLVASVHMESAHARLLSVVRDGAQRGNSTYTVFRSLILF
jgi:hypothetical protein